MTGTLLIGTHNPARISMIRQILAGGPIRAVTLAEAGITQEVEEDGATTAENAQKKALFYQSLAGLPALAMDGGLHIDRLPPEKQPGVLVKRVNGQAMAEAEMLAYYQGVLRDLGGESPATWTGSQALALSAGEVIVDTYTFTVRFTAQRRGAVVPGRALDSLMIDPTSGRYYSELADPERPYYQAIERFLRGNLGSLRTSAASEAI